MFNRICYLVLLFQCGLFHISKGTCEDDTSVLSSHGCRCTGEFMGFEMMNKSSIMCKSPNDDVALTVLTVMLESLDAQHLEIAADEGGFKEYLSMPPKGFNLVNYKSLSLKRLNLDLLFPPLTVTRSHNVEKLQYQEKDGSISDFLLDGLYENLEILAIRQCDTVYGWDWSKFAKKFLKLDSLIIEDSKLYRLTKDLMRIGYPRYVSLKRTSLQWITKQAIHTSHSKNGTLEWLVLAENEISELNKDHFAGDWNSLKHLDLRNNLLSTLDPLLFKQFVNLKELDLQENMLETFSTDVLPNWSKMTELWISGNLLMCDGICTLLGKYETKGGPDFWMLGKCIIEGNEKNIYDLTPEDRQNCGSLNLRYALTTAAI